MGTSAERAVEMWYSEIKDTPGGKGRVNSFNYKTGHYTQVVWKETTKLGCGEKKGIVVCQYGKGGNMAGAFEKNVHKLDPSAKCEGNIIYCSSIKSTKGRCPDWKNILLI